MYAETSRELGSVSPGEFPLECPSCGAGWYARKEGGRLGTHGNVWVSTPGRALQRDLSEWGHGCGVWPGERLPHSASVSLACRGRMEEASESDSFSVGLGQVSSLWASYQEEIGCGASKGFPISQRRRLITQDHGCQEGNPGRASGEGCKCWRGAIPPATLFPRIVSL